jgi:hypothetical protein
VRRAAALGLLGAAVAGCRAEPEPRAGLPAACGPSVPEAPRPLPPSFPRPAGRVLAEAPQRSGRMVQVSGFVTGTPTQAIDSLSADPGATILLREDEGADAELTTSDGRARTAWKFVVACPAGSRFTAVQAPEIQRQPAAAR